MKTIHLLLVVGLLMSGAAGLRAEPVPAAEGKYDVLAKTLMPYVAVFAKNSQNGKRAIHLRLKVVQMTGLAPELVGSEASVDVEYPDKLRIQGPFFGEQMTVCRNGQKIWVSPGSKLATILEAAVAKKKLPPPDPSYRLAPFRIPVSDKQLVFFPALFKVADVGMQAVGGQDYRALDVQLMPELAKALSAEGWIARLYVGADHQPVRVALVRKGWNAVVSIEEARLAEALPVSTWQPTAEQAGDVLEIPPSRYQQLLKLVGGGLPGETP